MAEKRVNRSPGFRVRLISLLVIPILINCMILESTAKDINIDFPNDSRVDLSFITKQPCNAPCWYGLELGKSSVEDIRKALLSLPFINSDLIREYKNNDPNEVLFVAKCVYSAPDEDCVWIETSSDGKFGKITLKIYYTLTLETAIEQLGSPVYYMLDLISGKDACRIYIHWPDANVLAVIEAAPREKYCINEKIEKIILGSQINQLIYTDIDIKVIQEDSDPWIEGK
jgi:hypothetical protein